MKEIKESMRDLSDNFNEIVKKNEITQKILMEEVKMVRSLIIALIILILLMIFKGVLI